MPLEPERIPLPISRATNADQGLTDARMDSFQDQQLPEIKHLRSLRGAAARDVGNGTARAGELECWRREVSRHQTPTPLALREKMALSALSVGPSRRQASSGTAKTETFL